MRAKEVELTTCGEGNDTVVALILKNARLVLFGKEFPKDSQIGVALFIPFGRERKFAWVFGFKGEGDAKWINYAGIGQNVTVGAGNSASQIVDSVSDQLLFPRKPGDKPDPCALIDLHDPSREGWLIAFDVKVSEFAQVWLAIADLVPMYALQIKLVNFIEIGALYRRVNDTLGMFSGEVNLADTIPPLQFGAASVRIPAVRAEVYTDGGWLIDLGYPWKNDYKKSFQLEIGIFLGGGGVYFGITAAAAADVLAIEEGGRYGYSPPNPNNPYLASLRALRMGIAFRVGIGRSLDLGVLKGEASLSIFGGLEGAVAFRGAAFTKPELYAIAGVVGLLVQIWAELDFVVLQARAEICAYVEFGFELRRVIGSKGLAHYKIDLPFTIFAEVGLYVHFEVWVTIGCVRVKLFDLTFQATWRIEEPMGDLKEELAPSTFSVTRRVLPKRIPWSWDVQFGARLLAETRSEKLRLYVMVLPCVADPKDVYLSDVPKYQSCLATHLMLERNESFAPLAKFMIEWALKLPNDDSFVFLKKVIQCRKDLGTKASWDGDAGDAVLVLLKQRFSVELKDVDPTNKQARFVPIPAWPGVTWGFKAEPIFEARPISLSGKNLPSALKVADPITKSFLDFIRLITEQFLAEIDRQIRIEFQDKDLKDAHVPWKDLWDRITSDPKTQAHSLSARKGPHGKR